MPFRRTYRWAELWLLLFPSLFMLVGLWALLSIPAVLSGSPYKVQTVPPIESLTPAIGLILALFGAHVLLIIFAPDVDQTILPVAGTLSSIGVLMALRLGPSAGDESLGVKQLMWVIIGLGLCVLTVRATRDLRWLRNYKYTWAAVGIGLVAFTLVRAHSFSTSTPSRDVLAIGPAGLSFQPSELLKICLVIFFAGYLSENREMLKEAHFQVWKLKLPPLKHLGPLLGMLGVALLIFVGVRELGLAILIFGLFLSMLYVASDRPLYIVASLLLFAFGAFVAYHLFSYARVRVSLVTNAFDPDPLHPGTVIGYQIVQGLVAFGTGGVLGTGLGLGHPCLVPACNTDFVASSFGEEFGFAGVLALIALFMLLVYRGMHVAVGAHGSFNQLLAVGLTSVFALQTLVILAGNLKLLPLTGVPLPFIAYGGSSIVANFIIIGLLLRLSQNTA
jgi:cell division protein FtsW (lipid II flippase)